MGILRVPIWKINFCFSVLRLSKLPRCKNITFPLNFRRLYGDDSDFSANQRQCASFLISVTILSLSFKWATIVPNKLIDRQNYKHLTRITLTAFFPLTTTQLNVSFLNILNYSETNQNPYFFATPTYFIQTSPTSRWTLSSS